MNMEEKSGPLLFLFFAWACAEDRLNTQKISKEDFDKLRECVRHKVEPDIDLLKKCFPNAAKNINGWSYDDVLKYWRCNHGHDGECAVREAFVCSISTNFITLSSDGKAFSAFNVHRFELKVDDKVLVHRRDIAYKFD